MISAVVHGQTIGSVEILEWAYCWILPVPSFITHSNDTTHYRGMSDDRHPQAGFGSGVEWRMGRIAVPRNGYDDGLSNVSAAGIGLDVPASSL